MDTALDLSQCPVCAGKTPAGAAVAEQVNLCLLATCIQCGQTFARTERSPAPSPLDSKCSSSPASDSITDGTSSTNRAATNPSAFATRLKAGLFSTSVHAVVILLLSFVWLYSPTADVEELTVVISESDEIEPRRQELELTKALPIEVESTVNDQTSAAAPVVDMTAGQPASPAVTLRLPEGFELSAGSSGIGAGGSGNGGMFAGTEDADSVAFVVDASGSMTGERMQRVLSELSTSIQSLREDQRFFLVFFSSKTFPMMWPRIECRLVPATPQNKDRVIEWAHQVVPDQNTRPQSALRMALKMKPQLLFFLTDGEIPDSTIDIAEQHCSRVTQMHSIEIRETTVVQESNPLLIEIAQIGRGTYRIVN